MIKSAFYFLVFCLALKLQAQDYNFKHLDIDQGLSQTTALVIHQDHLNRIWIGTREGLNVYDGTRVKSFFPNKNDSLGLLGYKTQQIKQIDRKLFILTENGINTLDLDFMRFSSFPIEHLLNAQIETHKGKLYLGTSQGSLFTFNEQDNELIKIRNVITTGDREVSLNSDDEFLWIGTENNGLLRYDTEKQETVRFMEHLISSPVRSIYRDNQNRIWVGTDTNGVYVMDNDMNLLEHLTTAHPSLKLSSNVVRKITEDWKKNIWIATFDGINIVSPDLHKITHIEASLNNPKALSWKSVFDLLLDESGNLWAGTYFGGVNYTDTKKQLYTFYDIQKSSSEVQGKQVIGTMLEDKDKNIWIATEGHGLNYYNTQTQQFKQYSESAENVRSLFLADQKLYMGTHYQGLNILDINSGKIKKFYNQSGAQAKIPKIVNSVIKYKDKFILGCRSGVVVFDPKTESFSSDLNLAGNEGISISDPVFSTYKDSNNKLWIGTEGNGLLYFDPEKSLLKRYLLSNYDPNSIGGNTIYKIIEDRHKRLWLATLGGGLSLYQPQSDNFLNFTKDSHNLPSNFVLGVSESENGNLWISTSKGISRFDINANVFYNYTRDNGFPLGELNQGGLLLTSSGTLYIGGIGELISVKEKDLMEPTSALNLLFSTLIVNNEEVRYGDKTQILDRDISVSESFSLAPEHTSFSIEYGVCNYSGFFNKYRVKLEGFDQNWVDAGKSHTASYTNLSPGEYKLRVQVLDAVLNKPIGEKSIDIKVNAPFFKSTIAKALYAFAFLAILFLIIYSYVSSIRLKLEVQDKENIRKLNQHKLQFFTNISHEFMTPLTLILGSLETILNSENLAMRIARKLNLTYNNALRLKHLSGELLDFRKLEQGHLKLKVFEHEFNYYLEELISSFSEQSQRRKIKLDIEPLNEKVHLWFDRFQLDKVFYNLISNAFKAVDDEVGFIKIKIEKTSNTVEVFVEDNGPGIPKESVKHVFSRFYQSENLNPNKGGSGIGLALSEGIISTHHGELNLHKTSSKGTVFKVTLLLGNEHFNSDEINPTLSNSYQENKAPNTNLPISNLSRHRGDDLASDSAESGNQKSDIKILIVEDNERVQDLLREVLEVNYHVKTANDGQEGLDLSLSWEPDLIISDVMMPNMSGVQMCTKIKRNIQTSHIPVILLTAKSDIEHKIEGLNVGADDYITKPFEMVYLETRIINIFDNRKRLAEKFKNTPDSSINEITNNSIDKKFMNETMELMDQHLSDEGFNVNLFAREMGYSRTLFFKKIKSITGQTPNDFIQSHRLKKAANILFNEPHKNVSEISHEVGFGSSRYFSKCFKEHFGVIPSAYRETKIKS
ncbi:MAG: response regulator [Cyclobacteriaceae bacterium]